MRIQRDCDRMNDIPETNTATYTSTVIYASYIAMLFISVMIFFIGLYLKSYEEVILAIPAVIILSDMILVDKKIVNTPPLMVFLLFWLVVFIFIGKRFDESVLVSTMINIMFGVVLGIAGLIITYSLLRTMPGIKDEKPFMISFVSLSLAISMYVILIMIQYYLCMISGDAQQTSGEIVNGLLVVIVGAVFVSMLFYLNKHLGLFRYTVTKYLENTPGTIGMEEYEAQEIRKAIIGGESEKVEYKSTLRTNLATGEKDPRMEKAVLKTVVAFLNSDGGTLLIGVADDGTAVGIDEQSFDNRDKLNLHMTNLISSQIGNEFMPFISFRLVDYEDRGIMRIVCKKSDSPVFLKEGKTETFYIRSGPSSVDLNGMDLLNYVKNRFKKNPKNRKGLRSRN